MLHEFADAAVVLELQRLGFAGLRIGGALICQRDDQTLIQEGQLAQALCQRVEVVFGDGKN